MPAACQGAKLDPAVKYPPYSGHERMRGLIGKLMPTSVSVIRLATVAGSEPASRAARYWPSLRSHSAIMALMLSSSACISCRAVAATSSSMVPDRWRGPRAARQNRDIASPTSISYAKTSLFKQREERRSQSFPPAGRVRRGS